MKSAIRKTGRAYIVRNRQVWYGLPIEVRRTALATIDKLFRNANVQLMRVIAIDEGKVPSRIDFVDALVRFYQDNQVASQSFHKLVSKQIDQLKERVPPLSRVMTLPSNTKFEIDAGRAFTVKGLYKTSDGKEHLVCIGEAAIALREAFGHWSLWTKQPATNTLSTLTTASIDVQKTFGTALGKLIAHEIRHQLNLSGNGNGLPGSIDGLGAEEAFYWLPDIKFTNDDKTWIQSLLTQMAMQQDGRETEPVSRN